MEFDLFFILRWFAIFLFTLSYALVAIGKIKPTSIIYPIMGLIGAVSMIIGASVLDAIQPIILNVVWGFFSIIAILKIKIPDLFKKESMIYLGSFFALLITFISNDFQITERSILSMLASIGITAVPIAYLLGSNGYISELKLHIYYFISELMFVGIVIYSGNDAILFRIILSEILSLYGIYKCLNLYKNNNLKNPV